MFNSLIIFAAVWWAVCHMSRVTRHELMIPLLSFYLLCFQHTKTGSSARKHVKTAVCLSLLTSI